MKAFLSFVAGAIFLALLFGLLGIFSAIFTGILWMMSNHLAAMVFIAIALWVILSFVARVFIHVILGE